MCTSRRTPASSAASAVLRTPSTFTARSYATADFGVEWRWQEEWSVRLEGDYTWQKYQDAVDDATSSGVTASIIYQPLQRSRARTD